MSHGAGVVAGTLTAARTLDLSRGVVRDRAIALAGATPLPGICWAVAAVDVSIRNITLWCCRSRRATRFGVSSRIAASSVVVVGVVSRISARSSSLGGQSMISLGIVVETTHRAHRVHSMASDSCS